MTTTCLHSRRSSSKLPPARESASRRWAAHARGQIGIVPFACHHLLATRMSADVLLLLPASDSWLGSRLLRSGLIDKIVTSIDGP